MEGDTAAEDAINNLEAATGLDLDGDGDVGVSSSAAPDRDRFPLGQLPSCAPGPIPSFPTSFEQMQAERRAWMKRGVRDMGLQRPERVARLLSEQDGHAMAALSLAQRMAEDDGAGTGVARATSSSSLDVGEIRQMIADERGAMEASMRALAEELARQNVSSTQMEQVQQLSASLEAALERVNTLQAGREGRRRTKSDKSKATSSFCTIS